MENILPPYYISGFVDGEGCFYINFRRDVRHDRKNKPVYYYWDIGFAITLRQDDKEILELIKNTLSCGFVHNPDKRGIVRYQVANFDDLLNKIMPFFVKYPLFGKKHFDFELWKEALIILSRNKQKRGNGRGFSAIQWDENDLNRLKEIKAEMEKYKSGHKEWKWIP